MCPQLGTVPQFIVMPVYALSCGTGYANIGMAVQLQFLSYKRLHCATVYDMQTQALWCSSCHVNNVTNLLQFKDMPTEALWDG